ncbi:MAG: hypothetical protein KDA79_01515, partial [Planctomycetaceae bacterium]|nr:hypothetical protein [Planctomycetaceae bacterium]
MSGRFPAARMLLQRLSFGSTGQEQMCHGGSCHPARFRRIVLRLCLVLFLLGGGTGSRWPAGRHAGPGGFVRSALAQDSKPKTTGIRPADGFHRVYVPTDLVEQVLRPGWVPVSREKLNRLLQAAGTEEQRPDPAVLTSARWTATLADQLLKGGRFHGEVAIAEPGNQSSGAPQLMVLPRSNLAWQSLLLDGQPAVWGTLDDGRTAIALPRNRRTVQLTGTWEYRGRQLARSLECRLALWPALSSTVELVLAAGLTVESNAGETEGPLPAERFRPAFIGPDTDPWHVPPALPSVTANAAPSGLQDAPPQESAPQAVWRLAAGSLSELKISVLQPLPRSTPPMTVLSQSDMTCVVREAGAEVSVDFSLEVLDGQTEHLRFQLPDDFQVHSVQLAGAVAGWNVREHEGQRELEVSLPVAIRGPGRPVQVRGEVPLRLGGGWDLPVLRLLDSVFVERLVHLQVNPPLELHGHTAVHTRQTEAVTSSDGGAILSFRQSAADARLTADIGYPRQVVGVQSLSLLTFGERQWQIQSELVWQVQSGTAWQVQCTVPAGWRITEVQGWNRWPEGDATGESALSSWSTRPNPDGSQLLLMEFLEALTPSRSGLVRIRALRTSAGGTLTDRLPIIQPIGAGTISTAVAVEHTASRHFELTRPGPFLSIDQSRLPAIVRTLPLWQRVRQPSSSRQLFLSTTPDASGRLRLSSVRPLYSSRVLVTVDVGRHSIRQRWQITLDDAETSGGQIHVWLPGHLPDLVWTLSDDPSTVLPSHVLDPADFPEWMLDASGTLLVVETGGRPAAELSVAAERTFPFRLPWTPTLAFVPGSSRFDAEVELRLRGTACTIQTRGMDQVASRVEPPGGSEHRTTDHRRETVRTGTGENSPAAQPSADESGLSPPDASPLHSVNRWEYHSIADSLTLAPESAQQAATAVTGSRLELHSDFATQGGTALHRARFYIPAGENSGAFIVQQPDVAGPVLCFLDGQPVPAGTEEPAIHRLPLSADRSHQVELRYSTPFAAGSLAPSLSIPLPQTPHPVAGFQWQIHRDGALQLLAAPTGLVTSLPPETISWFSRFFGPAGRPLNRGLFNPFSKADWRELWSPRPAEAARLADAATTGRGTAAASHTASHSTAPQLMAAGPLPGAAISIRFWNSDVASRIAWVCLLLSLLAGWTLRHRQVTFRGRAGAAALGVCLAGCCFLSPPGALICGGIVSGLLLAACLPRRLVLAGSRGRWASSQNDEVPVGSTATYRMGVPFLLLAAFALQGLKPAVAQNPASRPAARATPAARAQPTAAERRNELIIPVDEQQRPSAKLPVAWLHFSRLAELQQAASASRQPEFSRVLIRSIRWNGQLPESGAADLKATCEVIVLPGTQPAVLSLPFQGGNLAGPQPCTVDGQPREVTRDPATGSLQILLSGMGIQQTGGIRPSAEYPAAAEAAAGAVEQSTQVGSVRPAGRPPVVAPVPFRSDSSAPVDVTRHTVELQLRVPVQSMLADRSFTIHCPPANSAELELQVFAGCQHARIEQALGGTFCDFSTGKLKARLGACSEFTVSARTGTTAPAVAGGAAEPPQMTADIATLIDVTPNLLNHQTRIHFQTDQTPMDYFRLRLPPGAILRAAATEQPHRSTILPSSADGSREILIELTEAGAREVTARLSFAVPRVRNSAEIDVPVPDLLPRSQVDGFRLVRRSSLAAVSHPLEMHLQHTKAREPACVPVPVEEFLKAWGEDSLPRQPRFAFRIGGPSAIRLSQQEIQARRQARLDQTILVTRHRLEVLLEATLTTQDAPAFDHVLTTDPGLRISSVSVTEDQANRLQRWSHLDGRLVLYLSGRTTGTQQIQVRGSLPLSGNGVISLPESGLEEGQITHSTLDLYRTRDVEVRPGWLGGMPHPELSATDTAAPADSSSEGADRNNPTRRELIRDTIPLSHLSTEGELPELQLISVTPVTEPLVAESVLLIGREGRDGLLPVEIRLRLTGGLRQLPVLQLRIPAAPEEAFRLVDS